MNGMDSSAESTHSRLPFCTACGAEQAGQPCGCTESEGARPQLGADEAPRFGVALLLYFVCLGGLLLGAAIGGATSVMAAPENPADKFFVHTIVASDIILTLIVVGFTVYFGAHIRPLLTKRPGLWLAASLPLALLTIGGAFLYALLIGQMVVEEEGFEMVRPFILDGPGFGWLTVFIALQPAVIEELAFRGIIWDSLRSLLSPRTTLLVSSAMFMFLHMTTISWPLLFGMGLLLGWLRLRSGSLWPCMVLHGLHNFAMINLELWSY